MILTAENYHSNEAGLHYLSNSQYHDFCGTIGSKGCPARAMAMLRGEWIEEQTNAMLIGSYVDAYFSGTLEGFKENNPQIFTQKGELKADFRHADVMIERCKKSQFFIGTMEGIKQVIMTAEFFGATWKCAIDSYVPHKFIDDLKTCAEIRKAFWTKDYGYLDFISYWGYIDQMALYQKIVEINTGEKLPCLISAVSKEKYPDLAVIGFEQSDLDRALASIESNVPQILRIKSGEQEPDRCGSCDYCKATREVNDVVHFSNLTLDI